MFQIENKLLLVCFFYFLFLNIGASFKVKAREKRGGENSWSEPTDRASNLPPGAANRAKLVLA